MFTLGAQGVKILLQLLSVVTLSRLLTPHDYGLMAVVLVIIGVGEIFRDFGLTSASVQASELSSGQRDNLFWINTGIGVVLAIVMFVLAWPVQAFMHSPELVPIVRVLSVTFVLNGLTTQYRAQLMRALRFRAMAVIDIVAVTVALGSAIVAALLGAGYWALVLQQIVSCLALLLGAVATGRWLPHRYSRQYEIRSFVRFGWNLVGANLLSYGGKQVDTLIVAGRFGTTPLGLYNRSYQLIMTTFSQIRSPLSNVAIPVMSRVQRDEERFNTYVVAGQIALGYGLGIPIALVAGLADPVVQIMLGSQWTQAAPYMRFFCGATLMSTLAFVGYWVYVSRGLGSQLFRYSLVELAIRVVCIVVGSFFGMLGVAAGVFVEPLLSWSLSIYWLSRITPIPVKALWLGGFRILGLTGVVTAVSWLTASSIHAGAWLTLLTGIGVGAVAVAAFLIVPVYRRDARELVSFIRLMLRRDR
ncbi:lipopolysaccharide biosynthesis protein [Acidipropionibacterium acidipropionici]|nr:lipopolysaccharide biosynthesis protein [Acidipropionibacterium acidipropionici]